MYPVPQLFSRSYSLKVRKKLLRFFSSSFSRTPLPASHYMTSPLVISEPVLTKYPSLNKHN